IGYITYCIQDELVPIYKNDTSTCLDIMSKANSSLASCYITNGLCNISQDWKILFEVIDVKELFGSYQVFKQVLEAADKVFKCSQLVTWLDENKSDINAD
ncbi:8070_t:CDS:2, partial [Cetraspora pellucida]